MQIYRSRIKYSFINRRFSIGLAIASLAFMLTLPIIKVSASTENLDNEVSSFTQQDVNSDNQPEVATMVGIYHESKYQITVYDQNQDMKWSEDWKNGTDFLDDIWIYQEQNSRLVKLIIRFSHTADGYIAELFDDENNDKNVSYKLINKSNIQISESSFPTIKVIAQKPWILIDNNINTIIHIFIYRPIDNFFNSSPWILQYLPNNGKPSYEHEIVDSDSDNIPDYELIQAYFDLPRGSYQFRTALTVNNGDVLPAGFQNYFIWPYLGYADPDKWTPANILRNQDNTIPPIQIDWQRARIKGVSNIIPIWGSGNTWNFLTSTPLIKNSINELDWERFSYYNFSGENNPDLLIDMLQGIPGDPEIVTIGSKIYHRQKIAISWHQRNLGTLKWDYKLEMAGLHESPSTVVNFNDFSLREVPFDQALKFINEQKWAYATFVAAEDNLYDTNEGLYEWGTRDGVLNDTAQYNAGKRVPGSSRGQTDYIMGATDISPAQYYTDIRPGFRGEYADLLERKAILYLSAIDRRLHLLNASKGVWNLDGKREIRYENLGGETLNKWSLWQDGQELKTFISTEGYNVLAQAGRVQVMQAKVSPVLFTTQPPTNKDEWAKLGAELDQYKPAFAPDDFAAMYNQFSGPATTIEHASLRDFRLDENGFRFVLELDSGFSAAGTVMAQLSQLVPGKYLVTYDTDFGTFQMTPLIPTKINLEISVQNTRASSNSDLYQVSLKAINQGNQDSGEVEAVLTANCSGAPVELLDKTGQVLGNGQQEWQASWTPVEGKDCNLSAKLMAATGESLAQAIFTLPATGPSDSLASQILNISMRNLQDLPSIEILALIGLMAALLLWYSRHYQGRKSG